MLIRALYINIYLLLIIRWIIIIVFFLVAECDNWNWIISLSSTILYRPSALFNNYTSFMANIKFIVLWTLPMKYIYIYLQTFFLTWNNKHGIETRIVFSKTFIWNVTLNGCESCPGLYISFRKFTFYFGKSFSNQSNLNNQKDFAI